MILTDEEIRLLLVVVMSLGPIQDPSLRDLMTRMSVLIASKQLSMDVINGLIPVVLPQGRTQIGFNITNPVISGKG